MGKKYFWFVISSMVLLTSCAQRGKAQNSSISCMVSSMENKTNQSNAASSLSEQGSYKTNKYRNLFVELLGKSEDEVRVKIQRAFQQLYYGDDKSQRVYYPVEPDMAYILDVYQNDVRTEGMSYGLMIAVQMDKKSEFDRLWKWTKTYMQNKEGERKGYFAWSVKTNGEIVDSNSASDGEEWFVMALFFASARWGDGDGIYNYKAEAQTILDAMLSKSDLFDGSDAITNMFDKETKQVVFSPIGKAARFTDPSYHVPHFYELWAKWADKNNQFWADAVIASREFLKKVVHPKTGLAPDYAYFDGTPANPWGGGNDDFRFDAWRVAMNVAVDYEWFTKGDTVYGKWAEEQSNRLLNFFYSEGLGKYASLYSLEGKRLVDYQSPGLVAMNAVAALAATNEHRKEFVKELWKLPIPDGPYRYYDGLLYMLGMLQVSGNFRIYDLK